MRDRKVPLHGDRWPLKTGWLERELRAAEIEAEEMKRARKAIDRRIAKEERDERRGR